MLNQTDFASRIGFRAVTSGVMVSLCCMLLSLSLIAALGLWSFNLNELPNLGSGFWISFFIAWVLSLFCGGFVASLGMRSQNITDGVLNAVISCSASTLFFSFSFLFFAPNSLEILLMSATPQFYLRSFFGNSLALAFGVYGGVTGVHFEQDSKASFKVWKKVAHS